MVVGVVVTTLAPTIQPVVVVHPMFVVAAQQPLIARWSLAGAAARLVAAAALVDRAGTPMVSLAIAVPLVRRTVQAARAVRSQRRDLVGLSAPEVAVEPHHLALLALALWVATEVTLRAHSTAVAAWAAVVDTSVVAVVLVVDQHRSSSTATVAVAGLPSSVLRHRPQIAQESDQATAKLL